jgi:hypothetical protein
MYIPSFSHFFWFKKGEFMYEFQQMFFEGFSKSYYSDG